VPAPASLEESTWPTSGGGWSASTFLPAAAASLSPSALKGASNLGPPCSDEPALRRSNSSSICSTAAKHQLNTRLLGAAATWLTLQHVEISSLVFLSGTKQMGLTLFCTEASCTGWLAWLRFAAACYKWPQETCQRQHGYGNCICPQTHSIGSLRGSWWGLPYLQGVPAMVAKSG
jgi:hypothetical protein